MGLELLLTIIVGIFSMYALPAVLGYPPAWPLFVVGFLMALSFIGLYATANLGGRKMPPIARLVIGLASFAGAFWSDLLLLVVRLSRGDAATVAPLLLMALPALFCLLLLAVAGLRPAEGGRWASAAWALYAFALPMLGVRYLLVPLVGVNPIASVIAVQGGAVYLFLRGLLRIFVPTSAEGNLTVGPLIYRPVPDRIVGLVEGTTRRHARPFATRLDGTPDTGAISILCRTEDIPGVSAKLREALAGKPFKVEIGQMVEGQVELVVRPQSAAEPKADQ